MLVVLSIVTSFHIVLIHYNKFEIEFEFEMSGVDYHQQIRLFRPCGKDLPPLDLESRPESYGRSSETSTKLGPRSLRRLVRKLLRLENSL